MAHEEFEVCDIDRKYEKAGQIGAPIEKEGVL